MGLRLADLIVDSRKLKPGRNVVGLVTHTLLNLVTGG